jgi:hypothetical protein
VRSSPPTSMRAASSWSMSRNPSRARPGTRVSKADARIDLLFTMSDSGATTRPGLRVTQTGKSRTMTSPGWWSQTGSNRRPPACKAGALPTELWPRRRSRIRSHAVMPHRGRPLSVARLSDPKDRDPHGARASLTQGSGRQDHGGTQATPRRPQTASTNWWAWDDSNVRPHPYQGCALTT